MTDPANDISIHPALCLAVAEVLERMFFLDGLEEVEAAPPEPGALSVRLAFEGNPAGWFRMRLAHSAALAVAADFLGEDTASLTPQQCIDVVLELANMICGAVLSQIESSASFRLGTPQIVSDDSQATGTPEAYRYTVETGSGRLSVAIQMETRTCPATEK